MHRLLKLFLIFSISTFLFEGRASMVIVEGYVETGVVLVTDKQVIWRLGYSGQQAYQLISLNAQTGKEQWRIKLAKRPGLASADGTGAFYFMNGDLLTKAQLSTGLTMWQTNLFGIPEQTYTPPKPLTDVIKEKADQLFGSSLSPVAIHFINFSGKPDRFIYSRPLIAGSRILVTREGVSGSGCVIMSGFQDWLIHDQWNGAQMDGGPGVLLGGKMDFYLHDGESSFRIKQGEKIVLKDFLGDVSRDDFAHLRDDAPYNNSDDRIVLSGRVVGEVPARVMNLKEKHAKTINITKRQNYQQGWVILQDGLLRYSECQTYDGSKAGEKEEFWVELYGFDGKLLSQQGTTQVQDFWTSVIGINSRGKVLLGAGDSIITVDVPSLRMTKAAVRKETKFSLSEGGSKMVCISGDWMTSQMEGKSVEREVRVTMVDSETFAPLWERKETVKVGKLR